MTIGKTEKGIDYAKKDTRGADKERDTGYTTGRVRRGKRGKGRGEGKLIVQALAL